MKYFSALKGHVALSGLLHYATHTERTDS